LSLTRRIPSLLTLGVATLAFVGLGGCLRKDTTESLELASYGDDSLQTEANLESIAQSFVGGTGAKITFQSAAQLSPPLSAGGVRPADTVSNPAGGFYQPAGCLVEDSTPSKETATFTFNDCTGPFGLVHLTGVVDASWKIDGTSHATITLTSKDFKVNDATITTWTANADVTASGDARTMVWSAKLDGTTGAGRAFSRSNDKTIGWTVGGSCLTIDGTSTGTVTGLDLETTITSYSRCTGACPAAGSEVTVRDLTTGQSIDLTYLGGSKAQFTSVSGSVTDLGVACLL